jgi:hypothetical protein
MVFAELVSSPFPAEKTRTPGSKRKTAKNNNPLEILNFMTNPF